jgi:hypothetical protein
MSLCKMYNRVHINYSHLQIELNRGKTLIKLVNVLLTIRIELINIMRGFQAGTKNSQSIHLD